MDFLVLFWGMWHLDYPLISSFYYLLSLQFYSWYIYIFFIKWKKKTAHIPGRSYKLPILQYIIIRVIQH